MKRWLLLAVVLGVAGLVAGSAALYAAQRPPPYPSQSCEAMGIGWNSVDHQSGLSYLCGSRSVTDGRLSMTLNNYHFVDGETTTWPCVGNGVNDTAIGPTTCSLGEGVYLLANVTFVNVGKGNTSIGIGLYANVTNGGEFVGNGGYGIDAKFPGTYPNESVPATAGGAFLSPGRSVTYWFVFYVPNTALKDIPNLTLNALSEVERNYGGDWDGHGGFSCVHVACENPMVDLIVIS